MSRPLRTPIEIPKGGLVTPHGRLFAPAGPGLQVCVLLLAFAGGPALGWLVGHLALALSETARAALLVPYALVFFTGYAVWVARLQAIVFEGLGRALIVALFERVFRRRKPASRADLMPTPEKALKMLVLGQRAGSSFALVSVPIALVAGALTALADSATSAGLRFGLVAGSCMAWGCALATLARRGLLPFAEES